MEKENKKIGFFSRIKIAVIKLENYGMFLEEKISVAVKYFFLIVLFISVVMAVAQTYQIMKVVKKGYQYIQNELPDFSYEDGNLQFSERIFAYDDEYDIYMIADTKEDVPQETLQEYRDTIKSSGIIFLKDKVIYKNGNQELNYSYSNLSAQYGINSIDKNQLIEKINQIGMFGTASTILIGFIFSIFIVQVVSIFIDWIMISIFAMIASRVCGIQIRFKHAFNISIYALTFPIILSLLYNIAYMLTGFYIQHFRIIYLLISYVYVVAVILMIKSDLIKQQIEIAKIIEVEKEVKKEIEDTKEEEKNKENKEPEKPEEQTELDEESTGGEPDGSEI